MLDFQEACTLGCGHFTAADGDGDMTPLLGLILFLSSALLIAMDWPSSTLIAIWLLLAGIFVNGLKK